MLGGGYGALFLIKVDKHFNLVADVHIIGYVTLGKEDFAFLATVEIESEVYGLDYSEGIVVSESKHVSWGMMGVSMRPSRRWMLRSVILASASSWVTMTNV